MNIRKLLTPLVGFGALTLVAGCVAYPATYAGGPSCLEVIGAGTGCTYPVTPPPVAYASPPVAPIPYAGPRYHEHWRNDWEWRR